MDRAYGSSMIGIGGTPCAVFASGPYYCNLDSTFRLRGIVGIPMQSGYEVFGSLGLVQVNGQSATGPFTQASNVNSGFTFGIGIQRKMKTGTLRLEIIRDLANNSVIDPFGNNPSFQATTLKLSYLLSLRCLRAGLGSHNTRSKGLAKNSLVGGCVSASSSGMDFAQGYELRLWGSSIGFQPGENDAEDFDNNIGFSLGRAFEFASGGEGFLQASYQPSIAGHVDNDSTTAITEISYIHTLNAETSPTFGYFGLGASLDNGDNSGVPTPYQYVGIGKQFGPNNRSLTLQLGGLRSNDVFGETIQQAVFFGAGFDFDVSQTVAANISANRLWGVRWNSTTPSTGTLIITEVIGGLTFTPGDGRVSYYANASYGQFNTTNESDSPWVKEVQIGVTYRFGNKPTKSARNRVVLPRIGRWISTSANEIE